MRFIKNIFKKKEKPVDNFYAYIHELAFPHGNQQIEKEVSCLSEDIKDLSKEQIKSVLLKGTILPYLNILPNSPFYKSGSNFSTKELMKKIESTCKIPQDVAYAISLFLFMKESARRDGGL